MTKRLAWFVPAFLVAIGLMAFVAACAGDDDKTSTPGSSSADGGDEQSAQGYYKELEAIAQDVDARTNAASDGTPESEDPEGLKSFYLEIFDKGLEVVNDGIGKLEDLNPPDDVQPKHDALVAAVKANKDALDTLKGQIEDTDAGAALDTLLTTVGQNLAGLEATQTAACEALQADALTRNITIDLKCGD